MTWFFFTKTILFSFSESESLRCGVNEVPGRVRSCPPERTCRNRNIAFKCAVTPYVKKCVCATGYFRNSIGECITEAQCGRYLIHI